MKFVPDGENRGYTASWLLASAGENEVDHRLIRTTRGGFYIPDELALVLGLAEVEQKDALAAVPGQIHHSAPAPIPASTQLDPPDWWDSPHPKPDVVLGDDGKVYLTDDALGRIVEESQPKAEETDREVIRAWAKANGLNPAERGALKKSVVEEYQAAQAKE